MLNVNFTKGHSVLDRVSCINSDPVISAQSWSFTHKCSARTLAYLFSVYSLCLGQQTHSLIYTNMHTHTHSRAHTDRKAGRLHCDSMIVIYFVPGVQVNVCSIFTSCHGRYAANGSKKSKTASTAGLYIPLPLCKSTVNIFKLNSKSFT